MSRCPARPAIRTNSLLPAGLPIVDEDVPQLFVSRATRSEALL